MMKIHQLAIVSLLSCALLNAADDPNTFVDPFIGTGGHAHTFPGATLPHGLVQLSPDTATTGWDSSSGYHFSDESILGFSHVHLSGTGCEDLADILFMPTTGKPMMTSGTKEKPESGYRSRFRHDREKASPGYYSVMLEDYGVKAELTCTERTGYHRYTFPKGGGNVVIDLNHGVDLTRRYGLSDTLLEASLNFVDDKTVEGSRMSAGWAALQEVYFVAEFSRPFDRFGINGVEGTRWRKGVSGADTRKLAGWVSFDDAGKEPVMIRVGISAVSIANARENLRAEGKTWDFDAVKTAAAETWQKELGKITVEGNETDKRIFYTALYHTQIAPNNIADVNGEYIGVDHRLAKAESGSYYSTLSLWDTFRATHPLLTIIKPELNAAVINSMLDHHEKQGYLPIWTLWGKETHTMIANPAIPVIVDAWHKKTPGIDWERAWKAVYETSSRDHHDSRFSLIDELGYLPFDEVPTSVSRFLEIAYDDWCVAFMADGLGKTKERDSFLDRSKKWRNIFDKETGFMRGKNRKGEWRTPFDPVTLTHGSDYTEGNAWQYAWYPPQEMSAIAELMGGTKAFGDKLDTLFSLELGAQNEIMDVSGFIGQYAHGNEPSHHIAYLYNQTDRPWRTAEMVKRIIDTQYSDKPDGISGNEDCGQMSAWYVFSTMGFYPVNPAVGRYDFGTPRFTKTAIKVADGKTFTIEAKGLSDQAIYIAGIELNGKPYDLGYLKHEDLMAGGGLVFRMTADKTKAMRYRFEP